MFNDLNDFIAALDRERELARIAEPVSPDLEIAAVDRPRLEVPGRRAGAAVRAADRLRHAGRRQPVRLDEAHVHGARRATRSTTWRGEIDELTTPKIPAGMIDAMQDAAEVAPAARPDAEDGDATRPARKSCARTARSTTCRSSSAGRKTAGRTSPCRWSSRRIPRPAMRNIGTYRMQVFDGRTTGMHWQRHKGGAQHYRVAERLGKRHAGRGGARSRPGARLLGDGADARGARRADARRLPPPRAASSW